MEMEIGWDSSFRVALSADLFYSPSTMETFNMNGVHARRANHLLRAAVAIAIGAILVIGCVPAAAFADDSEAAAVRTAQAGTASAVVGSSCTPAQLMANSIARA